jgi:polygalacturonase
MSNMIFPAAGVAGASRTSRLGMLPRRRISRSLVLAGLAMAIGVTALPASAANWWSATPSVSIGSTTINVRDAGARGDGQHDDTSAFQAAINSLPSTGGTITVPAGTYMIDALRSINLRSHVRLQMSSGTQLVAIPNSSQRSYVIKAWNVNNVEIAGGAVVGERARHVGSTGEWGMGVDILASQKIYVHDINISDCWGDGVYIGATGHIGVPSTDVTLNNVVSNNNRRQGLSFGPVNRVYVFNSTFSNTHGTKPEAGIDVEPSTQGIAKNIRIERSTISGNAGSGLELQPNTTSLVIKSSTVKGNNGFGIYGHGVSNAWFAANVITENGLDGVALVSPSHDVKVTSNTITYNSTRWYIANNRSIYTATSSPRDLQIPGSLSNITVSSNTITPTR